MNTIFNEIIEQKIKQFKYAFHNSKDVFITPEGLKQESSKTPYFHNGEFGGHREAIVRKFLKYVVPQNFSIGDGFVLNQTPNGLSKQCDIVIYDKETMPLIENEFLQKFYPIESVVAIGEVKSTLTKQQLKDTLFNLSLTKKIRIETNHIWTKRALKYFQIQKRNIKESNEQYTIQTCDKGVFDRHSFYDQIFTFLICDNLGNDLSIESLIEIITEYQNQNNEFGINAILSIKDGLLCYHTGEPNHDLTQFAWFPHVHQKSLRPLFIESEENKNVHIKSFCSFIFDATSSITIYHPQLNFYFNAVNGDYKIVNMPKKQ